MPRYEYRCSACETTFEANQRMSEDPLTTCVECGAEGGVTRLLGGGSGLIFKGSGFYITDYKNAGSSPAATPGESSTKTETKAPAAAPASGGSCGSGCGCHS